MKHDICLLVWNRPEWTERVLESIDSNTDWKHVNKFYIMDDNSEEETREILENYSNPKSTLVSEDFGNSLASIKKFMGLTRTEILFICENDTLVPEHWNSILHKEISKDSQIGIVRGVTQDLGAERNYSTFQAGFRLEFLEKIRDKLQLYNKPGVKRWTKDHFVELLGDYKIKVVPNLYFDDLEYHPEEWPLIEEYYLKGWERGDYRYPYKSSFYKVTEEWREKGYI